MVASMEFSMEEVKALLKVKGFSMSYGMMSCKHGQQKQTIHFTLSMIARSKCIAVMQGRMCIGWRGRREERLRRWRGLYGRMISGLVLMTILVFGILFHAPLFSYE